MQDVVIGTLLGRGGFGKVYKGTLFLDLRFLMKSKGRGKEHR